MNRTSLNGYRFGCAVFGTLLGAAAVLPLVGTFGGGKHGWSMMGLIFGAIMAFVTFLTFFGTKEKKHTKADIPKESFFSTYKAVFSNKPYLILFFTYGLYLTGLTFLQSILAYYIEYLYPAEFVMRLKDSFVGNPAAGEEALRGTLTSLSMMALLLTAMICIPLSVFVSKKIGKKRTYQISLFTAGHLMPPNLFLLFRLLSGIGIGFGYVAPFAMLPDTVEFDAVNTGERKEGAYYGMWTFVSKVGMALSAFISGLILNWGGYVANTAQGAPAKLAIRLLIGPIPAAIFIGGLILMQFYPLDEKTYKKMMGQ